MILPDPPVGYTREWAARVLSILVTEDNNNLKTNKDINLQPAQRFIAYSPDGNRWALGVDNAGNTVWTPL